MRPRPLLFLLVFAVGGAFLPQAQAAPPVFIHVDMYPTGGGTDATPPGVFNDAACNADFSNFSKGSEPGGWQGSAHDQLNSVSLVCATLVDNQGDAIKSADIEVTSNGAGVVTDETGPPPSLATDHSVVGKDGFAWFFLSSTKTGTQQLTFASGDADEVTTTEVWDPPQPREARVIGCSPDAASPQAGSDQQISCTVTDGFGNGVGGVSVAWRAADSGGAQSGFDAKTTSTDGNGIVAASVTSTSQGRTVVTASIGSTSTECDAKADDPGPYDVGKPAGVCSDAATLDWAGASASELSITPQTVTSPQFKRVTFTATARDAGGSPKPGVSIQFRVHGANSGSGDAVTGSDGTASFTYRGARAGKDDVTAFADENHDGKQDAGELSVKASAVWTASCPGFQDDPRNQVAGTNGDDRLRGSTGYDIMCGFQGDDVFNGRGGDDTILGGDGNDRLAGGDGNDLLQGGSGNDVLLARFGADQLWGGSGADRLEGGDNVDSLHGGSGPDSLFGGAGNDDLFGGPGRDVLDGGAAVDFCRESDDRRSNCER